MYEQQKVQLFQKMRCKKVEERIADETPGRQVKVKHECEVIEHNSQLSFKDSKN